jgi:recombination protein RecR
VVESTADVIAIEQTRAYRGLYFVLMGKISPLDGIGPEDIALEGLQQQVVKGNIQEVILALNPTIEGQTTIHFIQNQLRPLNIKISQLAHGIPVGGELEFLNANTIGSALRNRGVVDYS